MTFKSFFLGLGIGFLSLLFIIWKFILKINKPHDSEFKADKLEKQIKNLETKKDSEQFKTIVKKINKKTHQTKEDLNEKTMSELIDMYNSKSDS